MVVPQQPKDVIDLRGRRQQRLTTRRPLVNQRHLCTAEAAAQLVKLLG
jgi:hypothetical protein